ncbi:MAG TPA: diaminopimelate decarboxylase [Chthoniobacterales bacterium]|nr:diaminopimelate decarboxylase [Chthoniobacterales bacterium]
MHAFHYRDGELHCEAVNLAQVAEKEGTPLYVYSASAIVDHYRRLRSALSEIDHLICYAVKANSNRAVLRLLREEGAGFDIVSGGELFRVLAAGGTAAQCTFAGVGKSSEEIAQALTAGVFCFNVESEAELTEINRVAAGLGQRAPVALRVNPNVATGTHKYISTGGSEDKFGIALEHVAHVYETAAQLPHLRIRGLQMHIGSQITAAAPFAEAIEKVTPLVHELQARYAIEFLSIGGGMGIAYQSSFARGPSGGWRDETNSDAPSALTLDQYAAAILPPLRALQSRASGPGRSRPLRILLEPGRFLVGNAGVLLTRVRYLKQATAKKFVVVDAGMNDLIRPALYGSYHEIVPVREPESARRESVDVVGPVCESGDFFAQERQLPEIRAGDLAALMSAGAYGFVMASNYNSRPLPAEVLVRGDRWALVRERQTYADLVRGEREADF